MKATRPKRQERSEASVAAEALECRRHVAAELAAVLQHLGANQLAPAKDWPGITVEDFQRWAAAWTETGGAGHAEGLLWEVVVLLRRMEERSRPLRAAAELLGRVRARVNLGVAHVMKSAPESMHWMRATPEELWARVVRDGVMKDTRADFETFKTKLRQARKGIRQRKGTGGR